jgi:putative ABC transport system permease protein
LKLFNIAFGNLKRRKAKVVFLVMGLFIGVATIVALLSITETMTHSIEENLDRFGANIVMLPQNDNLSLSYGGIHVGGVNYKVKEFNEGDLGKIHEIEAKRNLGIVAPKVLGVVKVKKSDVLLMGVDFKVEMPLKTWWHLNGDIPDANGLIIGTEAARSLHIEKGDTLHLGNQPFTVAAILAPTGGNEDSFVIGELHAMQKILGKENRVTMVEIAAYCRDCPISDMVLQIAEKFPGSKVTALKQAVMAKMQSIEMFKTFSFGIAGLVIFIGSLLVFVTMMGSVNERTREIGIFRAIGFRQGHIMQIILLEAVVVGCIGGIAGFAGGNLITMIVLPYVLPDGIFSGINVKLGIIVVMLAVSLSIVASYYPARKGSRLDPSSALRAL